MALFSGLPVPQWESPGDRSAQAVQGNQQRLQMFQQSRMKAMDRQAELNDPFRELKALQMQTQIRASAANIAESALSMRIKQAQIDGEAADKLSFANIITSAKGDEDKLLEGLANTQFMSPMGRDNATQMRLAAVARKSRDAFSKALGKLTPQGIARVSQFDAGSPEAWTAIENEGTADSVDIREIDVGGKPFAIFQVPGSKAFQIKDLGALSAVDMVKYRSATRRRDTAIADLADPIKGLKKTDLQRIIADAESEMSAITQAAPVAAPTTNAPAATVTPAAPTKSKVERANELSVAHPDWTREQIIQAVNAEAP